MYTIKTALRVLTKNKLFSFLNIVGFAIGIALTLLIALYVRHELTFDHFNKKADNIYRLDRKDWGIHGTAYGPDVKDNISGVQEVARVNLHQHTSPLLQYNDRDIQVNQLLMADPSFLDVFSFEFLQGDPKHALDAPFDLILTQSLARKIFGNENPVGKTLEADRKYSYTVTAVIEDVEHFHLPLEAITSFNTMAAIRGNQKILHSYGSWNYPTYILVNPGTNIEKMEQAISDFFRPIIEKATGDPNESDYRLTPLKEIYFDKAIKYEIGVKHGNKNAIVVFAIIGFFILLIATVNFINLSTAQAAKRAREVGIRKVVGSKKGQLMVQYLSESFVLTFISFLLAVVLVELFEPTFSNLFKTDLPDNLIAQPALWLFVAIGIIIISLLAGIYPALYLTSFKASAVLKGEAEKKGSAGGFFRKALTVFQFAITTILLISTIIILSQVHFMKNKDVGFEEEGILHFFANRNVLREYEAFREELLRNPNITNVSRIAKPAGQLTWQNTWRIDEAKYQFTYQPADPDFIPLMDLKMKEGENFDYQKVWQKEYAYVFNETAAKWMGLDTLVGHKITLDNGESIHVLGIVKDFHFNDLHQPIGPLVIGWDYRATSINVKVNMQNLASTINYLESTWDKFTPGFPLNYHFLDDSLDQLYQDDMRIAKLYGLFAGLAILIACLGLFGLSLFMSLRRTKEIGIRKVNGAKATDVVLLFLKEFSIWIIIANLLAWPAAYYFMKDWLQNYPYRIDIQVWPFILGFAITLVVALLTVMVHTLRVAHSNPVNSLRYE